MAMRDIRTRRTIILILAALAIAMAIVIYTIIPSGVTSMEILTTEGERLGQELNIYAGSKVQLECRVHPDVLADRGTYFSVADESIASVDETGQVTGLKNGETLMTIQHAGARQNITVEVQPSVKSIKGLPDEVTLYEGDGYLLEPKVVMAGKKLEVPDVTFKSKRTTIAAVDADGQITAGEPGSTTITVTAGTVSVKIPVTVISGY
ncbi:MAG: Ig-like domain-containing protein [Mogibacterium sp.]|nr:Ig-like domain-containing protein [Mogibacterium sp.]MBR4090360.1 Ig-like domain-containing protein [Mogibacterium sp.]